MRTSSDKRSIGKYRPESVRPDTGYGYGSGTGRGKKPYASVDGEMPSWSERRADLFDFVRQHLPEEHPGFAVTAAIAVQMTGRKLTRNAILERLQESDRTVEQLRAKGWME